MSDLIKALTILLKYGNPQYPTCCEHEILYIGIPQNIVSEDDKALLKELGVHVEELGDGFYSNRFGSA